MNWSTVTCKGTLHYWNYNVNYWSCIGGLSVVNATGTHLRDTDKLGTDPMAYGDIYI